MRREVFRAESLPVLQNRTFASAVEARASTRGDVVLVQDESTGLVYNAEFDALLLEYDADYQNEQACSPRFQEHIQEVSAIVSRHFSGQRLVEIGCGKGYFLEYLQGLGFDISGIDPAYEGENPSITKALFACELLGGVEGVILRHVLEHVANPVEFLSQVAHATHGKGAIYIEVPCFDWILTRRAWFDIFYEHVNYFRLQDFTRMFGRIHEHGWTFGGQYLYVVADLASLRIPRADGSQRLSIPVDFMAGLHRAVRTAHVGQWRRNVVWGAASKGVIFAIYMQRAGTRLDRAVDINPAKQGRFLPCSALEVASPAQMALGGSDHVFVMNSNYLDEIIACGGDQCTYTTVDS